MFYLRKEPYEVAMPQIEKTDGTIIPEKKYMTEDRALYKANDISRFYRRDYTGLKQKGFHLYQTKKISTILNQRENLYEYCGEWFDVYDENGRIDISNMVKCKKPMEVEKCDDNGFTIPNKYVTIKEGSFWSIDDTPERIAGGEVRLENENSEWIEISKESFEEYFQRIC
jgi:hypothetical protein